MQHDVADMLWLIVGVFVAGAIGVQAAGGNPTAVVEPFRVVFTVAVLVGLVVIAVSR